MAIFAYLTWLLMPLLLNRLVSPVSCSPIAQLTTFRNSTFSAKGTEIIQFDPQPAVLQGTGFDNDTHVEVYEDSTGNGVYSDLTNPSKPSILPNSFSTTPAHHVNPLWPRHADTPGSTLDSAYLSRRTRFYANTFTALPNNIGLSVFYGVSTSAPLLRDALISAIGVLREVIEASTPGQRAGNLYIPIFEEDPQHPEWAFRLQARMGHLNELTFGDVGNVLRALAIALTQGGIAYEARRFEIRTGQQSTGLIIATGTFGAFD